VASTKLTSLTTMFPQRTLAASAYAVLHACSLTALLRLLANTKYCCEVSGLPSRAQLIAASDTNCVADSLGIPTCPACINTDISAERAAAHCRRTWLPHSARRQHSCGSHRCLPCLPGKTSERTLPRSVYKHPDQIITKHFSKTVVQFTCSAPNAGQPPLMHLSALDARCLGSMSFETSSGSALPCCPACRRTGEDH